MKTVKPTAADFRQQKIEKKRKQQQLDKSRERKRIFVLGIVCVIPIVGLMSGVVAFSHTQNYANPYLFMFICALAGLPVGGFMAVSLKRYVILKKPMVRNDKNMVIILSLSVGGIFMLMGCKINEAISNPMCRRFTIVGTEFRPWAYRRPGYDALVVALGTKDQKLYCSTPYRLEKHIGSKVKVCEYQSPIGFNFYTFPEDYF